MAFASIAFIAGAVVAQGPLENKTGPQVSEAKGSEIAYRFAQDRGTPSDIAQQLGVFASGTDYRVREGIAFPEDEPPYEWKEFIVDSGDSCDQKITGVELAALRTEFADPSGWGRYAGEFLGPDCPDTATASGEVTSQSQAGSVFLPVVDAGGCRGYMTGAVDREGYVRAWEYERICPGGDLE